MNEEGPEENYNEETLLYKKKCETEENEQNRMSPNNKVSGCIISMQYNHGLSYSSLGIAFHSNNFQPSLRQTKNQVVVLKTYIPYHIWMH